MNRFQTLLAKPLREGLLVAVLLSFCACDQAVESDFAVETNSAVVELREGPTSVELAAPTQVVVLGTGTPIPDPRRAGPSIAVIHRGESYLFDIGSGSIRNAIVTR